MTSPVGSPTNFNFFFDQQCLHYQEEISRLKKDVRSAEADLKTTKAILEQKVELLEIQLDESRSRENNLKKLQDTMLRALDDSIDHHQPLAGTLVEQELELLRDQHDKEVTQVRERYQSQLDTMILKVTRLDEEKNHFESKLSRLGEEREDKERKLQLEISNLQNLNDQLKSQLENTTILQKNGTGSNSSTDDLQVESFPIDEPTEKLLDKVRKEYEERLNGVTTKYHQLEGQMKKEREMFEKKRIDMNETIKKYQNGHTFDDFETEFNERFDRAQTEFLSTKNQLLEEIGSLKRQRNDSLAKLESVEGQLARVKVALRNANLTNEQTLKNAKTKEEKAKQVFEANDLLQEDLKKLRKQISNSKALITKLEMSDKKNKVLLQEKDTLMDQEKRRWNRKLEEVRRKSGALKEGAATSKSFEKKNVELSEQLVEKSTQLETLEDQIKQLESELDIAKRDHSSATSSFVSVLQGQGASTPGLSKESSKSSESPYPESPMSTRSCSNNTTTEVNLDELKLMFICQKLIAFSSVIECELCKNTLSTTVFCEHLTSEHKDLINEERMTEDFTKFSESLLSGSINRGGFDPLASPTGSEQSDIELGADKLKARNKKLEDKLKTAQTSLRETKNQLQYHISLKEHAQKEFDKAIQEVKKKRGQREENHIKEMRSLLKRIWEKKNIDSVLEDDDFATMFEKLELTPRHRGEFKENRAKSPRSLKTVSRGEAPEELTPTKKVNHIKSIDMNSGFDFRSQTPSAKMIPRTDVRHSSTTKLHGLSSGGHSPRSTTRRASAVVISSSKSMKALSPRGGLKKKSTKRDLKEPASVIVQLDR